MDEILIGEKKYLSSKQAAKVTGYAKDYIGQLCREGRVPARLVGRSWYVLEAAIHDHRFGDQKTGKETREKSKEPRILSAEGAFSPTWESPRYESASPEGESIPVVSRSEDDVEPNPQHLQDSWREWFDRVANAAPSIPDVVPEREEEPVVAEEIPQEEEVNIPIRTVYEQPPEELLPRRHVAVRAAPPVEDEERPFIREVVAVERRTFGAIRLAGAMLALIMAVLAVAGSGYFDEYIISNSQVGMIAGVGLYNR